MSNALTTHQTHTFGQMRETLSSDGFQQALMEALPNHITPERMARVALSSMRRNPKILDCDQASILKAIVEAAQLGLEVDGILGQAYLVPYSRECQLLPGYLGLIELCRRSGELKLLKANVVRQGDHFHYQEVPPELTHKRESPPDAPITHVYAWAQLNNGAEDFVCWTTDEIEAHRKKYVRTSKKDTPWDSAWEAMAKKTVIRQLLKLLPKSIEIQRLVQREEYYDSGVTETRDNRQDQKRVQRSALNAFVVEPTLESEPTNGEEPALTPPEPAVETPEESDAQKDRREWREAVVKKLRRLRKIETVMEYVNETMEEAAVFGYTDDLEKLGRARIRQLSAPADDTPEHKDQLFDASPDATAE